MDFDYYTHYIKKSKGLVVIISGPSGVGKDTLIQRLLASNPQASKAITCTTRKPRPDEANGINYHFKTLEEFATMIDAGEFLEYAEVHGNLYGTPLSEIRGMRDSGIDVILGIDVQGGTAVKRKIPDAVMIFVAPPSMDILEQRLRGRGTDQEDVIKFRMKNAIGEMEYIPDYEYLVVNDDIDPAVELIKCILKAEHARIRKAER
jgi:guanylate kinase